MSKRIPLTKGYFAIVDDQDYEWLSQWKWRSLLSKGKVYAIRHQRGGYHKYLTVLMHRQIMDAPIDKLVDHRDGNGLNNQRDNLRLVNNQQNSHNSQGYRKGKTSKFKGVSWDKEKGKWGAYIRVNGKVKNLGRYISEVDAARVYDDKARQFFGEFAWLNFPKRNNDNE